MYEIALTTMGGIILGTIISYYALRHLLKKQAIDLMTLFGETKEGKEITDLIHRLSEYTLSEDATVMGEDLKTIVKNVKHFTSFKLILSGNPGKELINLPAKPENKEEN